LGSLRGNFARKITVYTFLCRLGYLLKLNAREMHIHNEHGVSKPFSVQQLKSIQWMERNVPTYFTLPSLFMHPGHHTAHSAWKLLSGR
jgi:hypothetical protein